jgi:autophagy-related protein 18
MNRKRLVAVLEEQIYIYDIATMKHVYTIETGSNPNGLLPQTLIIVNVQVAVFSASPSNVG